MRERQHCEGDGAVIPRLVGETVCAGEHGANADGYMRAGGRHPVRGELTGGDKQTVQVFLVFFYPNGRKNSSF